MGADVKSSAWDESYGHISGHVWHTSGHFWGNPKNIRGAIVAWLPLESLGGVSSYDSVPHLLSFELPIRFLFSFSSMDLIVS